MKESDDDNNNFYQLSENNIVNTNNHLILSFDKKIPKEEKPIEYNINNDTYKIIMGKYNKLNDILYESNKISTSKYNLLNLFPKILMEQLSRICNIYLLIIALLQSIKSISFTDGYPLVLIPLTSLILLNGFKDYIEDRKRKETDKKENNNSILIYNQKKNKFVSDIWQNIKLGDIIKVKNGEKFPCDLIFIESSPESKGQCKVDTKNINGETNLNIKSINPKFNFQNLSEINHLCITKKPNEHIYEFEAIFHSISIQNEYLDVDKDETFYFNYDNFILRGSSLKQTDYIIGIAVYIGHNTKSMKNNPSPKQKISKLEIAMNYQILLIFILQIILSIIASIINLVIFYSNNKFIDKFVKIAENQDTFFMRFIKMIGTWTLMLTKFVPIPLLSSLEFIKFFQAMFISKDADMTNKNTMARVRVQSSTLNDELGQINYIFTDKTGTLTKNNMQFKAFAVGEQSFGQIEHINEDKKINQYGVRDRYGIITNVGFIDSGFKLRNELINKDQNGNVLLEHFYLNIVLNNSAIIDNKKFQKKGEIEYVCSSTDEKCLLNFARYCGYIFVERTLDNTISIEKIMNQNKLVKLNYKISNILEFTSERQRMSVIIKSKDAEDNDIYLLYIKGSDYILNKKVANKESSIYKNISKKIKEYSENGLRILVFGYRLISEEEYNNFDNKYKEILYDIHHKESDFYDLYDEIEDNIELLGVTAIEDELQDNVKETIYKFSNIGIKICMLTGDKIETAKKIASNCNLITKDMNFIDLIEPVDSKQQLENNLNQIYTELYPDLSNTKKNCLIITGDVFFQITSDKTTIKLFSKLFALSKTIICCRISPKQKAQIVTIIKEYNPEKLILSIGDGANDVGMIMESDVGIGIQGKEGVEAARASDYSLPEFSYLQKLLLYHGRENYRRNSYYIIYEFYKNAVFASPILYFGFYSFFSGESFYDKLLIHFFDMLFASFPMFYFAIFDKEYDNDIFVKKPQLYLSGINRSYFNIKLFWKEMLMGFVEGLVLTVNGWMLYNNSNEGYIDNDVASLGLVIFSGVVIDINIKILTRANVIDYFLVGGIIVGIALLYLLIYINSINWNDIFKKFIEKIAFLVIFSKSNEISGCNDNIIIKGKYFCYFLFSILFVCFFDIAVNRFNFGIIKNLCKKKKDYLVFKTNKYLIDGVNEGVFEINEDNIDIINIGQLYDDRRLLKNNTNYKINEISTSINDDISSDI